jgi:hypothetical protein
MTNKSKFIIFLVCGISLLYSLKSESQIKSLLDSDLTKFNVGFDILIPASQNVKITIYNEDKSVEHVLFDSTLKQTDNLIFIFSDMFEKEKNNYDNNKLYKIPINASGVYYIEYYLIENFVLVK